MFFIVSCQLYQSFKKHQERIKQLDKKLVKHVTNPEEITKEDKEYISDLDYDEIEFLYNKKILARLRWKTIFASMCLVMKMS